MSDKVAKQPKNEEPVKESLEEDDEFEEFPADEWGEAEKEKQIHWEENWDDDNKEDDFSKQLKAVLDSVKK